ncbi:MAG TPA: hypothetical protein VG816_07135 [Solirubrobacterales bacterium]|nr:hypothetical protein [Solirubrobacterales bacterium]
MSPDEKLELLRRFAPTLHFDALERWRPDLVDNYLRHSSVLDGSDRGLPTTPPAEPAMNESADERKARLNPLAHGAGVDTQKRSNEMLEAYGGDQDLGSAGVAYGRVVPDGQALFLQYWLFYPDNPCVLPPGRHDGDWEFVQVRAERAGEDFHPTHLTLAEHGKPVNKPISSLGEIGVFVAVDSHACYFEEGANPIIPLSDVCEPAGTPSGKPEVVLLPVEASKRDWAHWRGRWGLDRGPGTLLALMLHLKRTPWPLTRLNKVGAGESPVSPGHQGQSWNSPGAFATRGSTRTATTSLVQRFAHFLGNATWPDEAPRVSVIAQDSGAGSPAGAEPPVTTYRLEAEVAGHGLRRVTMVAIAFWEERSDGSRRALALETVRPGEPKTLAIPHEGELEWRAAGYNLLRQRGRPVLPKPSGGANIAP